MRVLVACLMLILSGCARSNNIGIRPDYIPSPPPELASRCDGAPVVRDAIATAALARRALARCAAKHDGLVDWVSALRKSSGGMQ